jgi:hypothetical protein
MMPPMSDSQIVVSLIVIGGVAIGILLLAVKGLICFLS